MSAPRRRTHRHRAGGAAALLVAVAVAVPPPAGASARTVAPTSSGCPATTDLLSSRPVATYRPAPGVRVRVWSGHDAPRGGHGVRLAVAEADLHRVRLAASAAAGYGAAAGTTDLTAGTRGAVVGVNGDYFSYDWTGAAVPYGPVVRAGRLLRVPPGALPAVGADAAGLPVAGGVRAVGTVAVAGGPPLRIGSVDDEDGAGSGDDPVSAGSEVAVVTPRLGTARPWRPVEVVVRAGRVAAVGRRLSFGAGDRATWGSGSAGRGDLLLSASGAAGRALRALAPGTTVTVRYTARFAPGGAQVRDAVGRGSVLLRGGRDLAGCTGSAVESRPRTMIAWDARRTRLWLLVASGDVPGVPSSRFGLTYRQVTEVARALGATEAVMVDGGGSSTMAVRIGGGVQRVDAAGWAPQRPVPDGLVLVPR